MNQNPEQLARDKIDEALLKSGWIVQSHKQNKIAAGLGVAKRGCPTDTNPTDYILFVNSKTVGVIEAKENQQKVLVQMATCSRKTFTSIPSISVIKVSKTKTYYVFWSILEILVNRRKRN